MRRISVRNRQSLTPRQQEIMELLALGMTNDNIADYLGLELHSVVKHLSRIYAKLGVKGTRGGRWDGTRIKAIGAFWRQGWRPNGWKEVL